MRSYRYLIVGGGMTGDAACKGIREHDADGTIGLVGSEPHPPYARPPLTKGLWSGDEEDSIWRGTDAARRRRAAPRPHRRDPRPRPAQGARRPGRGDRLREAPARDRRQPAHAQRRQRRRHLLPHARRLPAAARARDGGRALRRDRRRLHRLGDRSGARVERLRGDDDLPRGRDRRADLPGGPLRVRHGLLPRERACACSPRTP